MQVQFLQIEVAPDPVQFWLYAFLDLLAHPNSGRLWMQDTDNANWVQATGAQQAEMKKIQGLQGKLGAELASLSQKMTNLQTNKLDGGAEGQVRH